MRTLEEAAVTGKRVLLRLGSDLPLLSKNGEIIIADDYRLRQSLPTLHYLIAREAKIIILSHQGRPNGKIVPELSLRPVYLQLSALLKQPIQFAPHLLSPATAKAVAQLQPGQILGLENTRFEPGEDNNSRTFARALAQYGELYVNDAFSAYHDAASTVAITEFLPSVAGLLMEKEVHVLQSLLTHPARPFVALIGGAKIEDKLPVIARLLEKADRVLVGGGVANTFLAALGSDMRKSLVSQEHLAQAKTMYQRARGKIVLPLSQDLVWSDDAVMDIGPSTVTAWKKYLTAAKTIFWNGSLGKTEEERFAQGSEAIARLLAASGATTVVGGGNTIEVLTKLRLVLQMTFVSTGGGATLKLIAGEKLPALEALKG